MADAVSAAAAEEKKTAEATVVDACGQSELQKREEELDARGGDDDISKVVISNDNNDHDCIASSSVLDSMDDCVGCVEGVAIQQDFERKLGNQPDLPTTVIERRSSCAVTAPHASLSASESALIRLQIMDHRTQHSPEPQHRQEQERRGGGGFKRGFFPRSGIVHDDDGVDLLNTVCCSDEDFSSCPPRTVTAAGVVVPATASTTTSGLGTTAAFHLPVPSKKECRKTGESADTTMDTEASEGTLDGSFASSEGDHTGRNDPYPMQCSICLDEATSVASRMTFARLPCCGDGAACTEGCEVDADGNAAIHSGAASAAGEKICTACILVLTDPTSDGAPSRVGRCPRCRTWIVATTKVSESPDDRNREQVDLEIRALETRGECQICCQDRPRLISVSDETKVCDACFLGQRQPFLYECEQCHVWQRIPHPMYRYQRKPDQFGNMSWACQGRCANFAHWKIREDQIPLIPVGDTPAEWGDDYLRLAQQRVREARAALLVAVSPETTTTAIGSCSGKGNHFGCTIM